MTEDALLPAHRALLFTSEWFWRFFSAACKCRDNARRYRAERDEAAWAQLVAFRAELRERAEALDEATRERDEAERLCIAVADHARPAGEAMSYVWVLTHREEVLAVFMSLDGARRSACNRLGHPDGSDVREERHNSHGEVVSWCVSGFTVYHAQRSEVKP